MPRIKPAKGQTSLISFEDPSMHPTIPETPRWPLWYELKKEKEVLGIYVSRHPLDQFTDQVKEIDDVSPLSILREIEQLSGRSLTFTVVVDRAEVKVSKKGNPYAIITVSDRTYNYELPLFGENYVKYSMLTMGMPLCVVLHGVVKNRENNFAFSVDSMKLFSYVC